MAMGNYIIWISVVGFVVISIFLPWVNLRRIRTLNEEVDQLKKIINRPYTETESFPAEKESQSEPAIIEEQLPSQPETVFDLDISEANQNKTVSDQTSEEEKLDIPPPPQPIETPTHTKQSVSFEQQFGARLPVWVGGIALMLAGFFLVKYSIEKNLLGPQVRVLLGGGFGIAMLIAAHFIRNKPDFANQIRISQSLSGAGVAVLYLSIFAAASLYQLIHPYVGYLGMGMTTVLAVFLSLRHGPPIALIGLVTGFLTPKLIGSHDPSAAFTFTYLYILFAGLMFTIKKQNWWWLSIPATFGAILWVIFWLTTCCYLPGDSIWLGLFLLAVSATLVITSRKQYEEDAELMGKIKISSAMNYIGLAGAIVLMGIVAGKAGFGWLDWGLFGLLTVGGIVLAVYNNKLYGFVPWILMPVNAVMLFVWDTGSPPEHALLISIFAVLYIGSGYFLMWHTSSRALWAGLVSATSIGYFLLAYYKFHEILNPSQINFFWGGLALALGAGAMYTLYKIYNSWEKHEQSEYPFAIFAVTATAFVSLAMTIELDREFLSIAFAAELLTLAWLNNRMSIKALRPLASIILLIFVLLLTPQLLLLVQLMLYSLVRAKVYLQATIPFVDWPVFQLGIPAVLFIASSILLRRQKDDALVKSLEYASIALIGIMGYYVSRHAFHPNENVLFVSAGFIERGFKTNIIFLYGLLTFWIGRKYDRNTCSNSGIALCGAALFRIIFFDLLLKNPLWTHQQIDGWLILNALLLPFALPIIWLWLGNKELDHLGRQNWKKYFKPLPLIFLFALITFNVRSFFHGIYLDTGVTSNAEIYSYSVAWLLFAIALIYAGISMKNKPLRIASLALMVITVGKVFLYDASELEGLYRVFSFLGLGLCLIGLSYFYTRYVFGEEETT
jgi:uncharacterized membrane protein